MKRLYYLADNLDMVDDIAAALHRAGIKDWNFHVLNKDEAGLYKHHLHSATPLHRRDVVRTGERGALLGFGIGLLVAIISVLLLESSPFHSMVIFVIGIAVPTLFGAWVGGMVGLSLENHKIARFRGDIEAGRSLLMVDVDRAHYDRIRQMMRVFAVQPGGEDSTVVAPFTFRHA